MRSLFQYGVVYMLVSLALLFTLVPLLGIQSYWPLVLVALLSGRSLVSAFFTAVLQAREKFLLLSIIGIILAFTRLTTSLLVIPYPGIIVAIAALLMTAVVSASLFSYFGRQALVGLDSDISL